MQAPETYVLISRLVHVPKETVEVLTFAGERTVRYDAKKLRWTINGMTADVSDETDMLILATFLKGGT